MPAAAVIPAPIAYIKVVAVKKLVVEFQGRSAGFAFGRDLAGALPLSVCMFFIECVSPHPFTVKKLECLKQA